MNTPLNDAPMSEFVCGDCGTPLMQGYTCGKCDSFSAVTPEEWNTRANTTDSAAQGAMGDESACNRYKDSERAACVEAIRFTRQDVKYIWAAFIKYADCVDDPRKVIHDKAKALILCSSTEASDAGRQG